jgi:hypothetical protein
MPLSQKLLIRAFKHYVKQNGDISIKKLAEKMKMPYSTVYNPLLERRQCNADNFLKMMSFFGAVKIDKKGIEIIR